MISFTLTLSITNKNLFYYYILFTLILSITALSTHYLMSELSEVYLQKTKLRKSDNNRL